MTNDCVKHFRTSHVLPACLRPECQALDFHFKHRTLSNEFAYLSGPQLCKEAPTFVIYLYWNVELMGYSANRVVYNNNKILLFREKNIFFLYQYQGAINKQYS